MWLYPVPIGIGLGRGGGACNRELPRIPLPRTPVNRAPSGLPCTIFLMGRAVRELLERVHKGFCKLFSARRCHMMDRTAANSRMDHGAEGARAEWLSAMQSLAEQIERQQQNS